MRKIIFSSGIGNALHQRQENNFVGDNSATEMHATDGREHQ